MIRKPDKDDGDGVDRSDGDGRGSSAAVSLERRIRMLRTAMGPEIAAALEDPEVVEVLLNPDGTLWLDRLGSGRAPTGTTLPPAVAERIIRLVAAHVRAEVNAGQQDTEAGYLYLCYDVPGSRPQELWAHWGAKNKVAFKSGQITVKSES